MLGGENTHTVLASGFLVGTVGYSLLASSFEWLILGLALAAIIYIEPHAPIVTALSD